jgi:glyoxylase-like metal-dependent hydrolase (beta-lactamase superfamily II)
LFALPDDTIVYPGHDHHGRVSSTIGEEKRFNERLNLSIDKAAFVAAMAQRRTALPARMDIAIPANMRAGRMAEAASDRQPTSR